MFVNSFYHGIGRMIFSDQTYFYGNWRNGKKYGKMLVYDNSNHKWLYYRQCGEKDEIEILEDGEGYPPYHLDAYKDKIEETAVQKDKLDDPDFYPELENIGKKYMLSLIHI